MSFFLRNVCQFNNCSRAFHTLHGLIKHIESTHIDFDPETMERIEKEKPQCVPMSYILRYDRSSKADNESEIGAEIIDSSKIKTEPLDSDQTPLDHKDYFQNPIWMAINKSHSADSGKEKIKRFTCPIKGCSKRYKNQNGMKYHIMNHHDVKGTRRELVSVPKLKRKEHKCSFCGKLYKTTRGLHSHIISTHSDRMGNFSGTAVTEEAVHVHPKLNVIMPPFFPTAENCSPVMVKSEEKETLGPAGGNQPGNEVNSTFIRSQIYRNPFYFDLNVKYPTD